MKWTLFILGLSLCLFSCAQPVGAVRAPDTHAVGESLANIDSFADKAEKKAPEVEPEMTGIKTETKNIAGQNQSAERLVKEHAKALAKIQELEGENTKLLNWIKVCAFVLGFALIVGALVFRWPTMSLALLSFTVWGGLVVYGVFTAYSVWITGIIGALFFIAIAIKLYREKTFTKIKLSEASTAISELIGTTEAIKLAVPELKPVVFGEDGIADKLQSQRTKEIVKNRRKRLGLAKENTEIADAATPTNSSKSTSVSISLDDLPPSQQISRANEIRQREEAMKEQIRATSKEVQARVLPVVNKALAEFLAPEPQIPQPQQSQQPQQEEGKSNG